MQALVTFSMGVMLSLMREFDMASIKKAKTSVPASAEEHIYDFDLMIDLIESAAYDAKSVDLRSLSLPEDVTKQVTKHSLSWEKLRRG